MPLVDDLKTEATNIFQSLEAAGQILTRDKVKTLPFDLLAMDPAALQLVVQAGQYLARFTTVIDGHKASLLPWVTVYGAGLGMQAVFNRILMVWARTPLPSPSQPDVPPLSVKAAIDQDIPLYVKLIAT
jgi:hypothetical protein